MRLTGAIPNAISLSRIPAAIAFLLLYSTKDATHYCLALAIAFFALVTDLVDGYLARHWRVASEVGYFIDGLSDKVFYVAIILVATREQFTSLTLAWLLIVREVVLYALRSIDPGRMRNIEHLKPFSRLYALFLRLYFVGFVVVGGIAVFKIGVPPRLDQYLAILAFVAVALGYISLAKLVREIAREI
jgi:phosphatidylglycerophosphate synthase